MGHALAGELDTTPWEALLTVLRRQSYRAAWYESQLAEVTDEYDLLPGGAHHPLVLESERANERLAKYAKMALDAGVAEQLVTQYQLAGAAIAGPFIRVIEALTELGLDDDTLLKVRATMRHELLALEGQVIEGESEEVKE